MFKTNLQILILTLYAVKSMANAADSCETSRETVVKVNKCPETKSEWIAAATRKNCRSLAGSCQYPNRFVYHCVLNPFANETLEVCAYPTKVFLGRCTEYSTRGNLIQENRASCSSFPKACPNVYLSTDAYEYQDCYRLVQRPEVNPTAVISTTLTTFTKKVTQKNFTDITSSKGDNTTSVNKVERSGGKDQNGDNLKVVIVVMGCVVGFLLFILLALVCRLKRRRCESNDGTFIQLKAKSSKPRESNPVESSNLIQQRKKQSSKV